jgi:hypothetical protein
MDAFDVQAAQALFDLTTHPGYLALRAFSETLDLNPDERLTGSALREDIYYKACQREGIQKLFRMVECQLFVLNERVKMLSEPQSKD